VVREVDQDELIDAWTIVGDEPKLIGGNGVLLVIRRALGFREYTVADADALRWWLADEVTQVDRGGERVREYLLAPNVMGVTSCQIRVVWRVSRA
jgi:hypothetical protein